MWLPDGEKFLKICLFISTEYTNVTDRRTDGRTLHDGIGHARGKKYRPIGYRSCGAIGQVWSRQENWTHVHLCHTCNRFIYFFRWSFHYHSIKLAAQWHTTIIELARVRPPARYICFLYNAITGRLLLPAIPMLTRRLIELDYRSCGAILTECYTEWLLTRQESEIKSWQRKQFLLYDFTHPPWPPSPQTVASV